MQKNIKFNKKNPLFIAGPCSAETEEQVLTIAHALKNSQVNIFRAGVWKPRTRPGSFEGVGEIGLQWLQRAKEETGMKIAVEVASAKHVELALKHNVDVLWVGARTTVSPFTIQEIAAACKGISNQVLVKNPINPDLPLWIGALERFLGQNVTNLGAIHRGFSAFEKSNYRNEPYWSIPVALKNEFPNIPLLFDPSHVAGDRNLISELTNQALQYPFDGLLVETHHNPAEAWSDASQQIVPDELLALIDTVLYGEEAVVPFV